MIQAVSPIPRGTAAWHLHALGTSSRLTTYFWQHHRPNAVQVTPERVIEALNEAGIKPVLMGTYGITGWRSEPRATQDVDVLVAKRNFTKAGRVLRAAYPSLTVSEIAGVTRFVDPATGLPVIDVMKPTCPVNPVVFRHTLRIRDTHGIPDLEISLACKFAVLMSPKRELDEKCLDAGDFLDVVENNRDGLDLQKLRRLADEVCPTHAAAMMLFVEDHLAARRMNLRLIFNGEHLWLQRLLTANTKARSSK
jgi:hypothetical protein